MVRGFEESRSLKDVCDKEDGPCGKGWGSGHVTTISRKSSIESEVVQGTM